MTIKLTQIPLIWRGGPMQTECSTERSVFGRVEGRSVLAEFDGGALTSDSGGLLLGAADLLRADSGFAREALMAWCEMNQVDFVFGLARNARLVEEISVELLQAEAE